MPRKKKKITGSTTPTDAFAPASASGPARRESAGRFILICNYALAPTSRSGAETAQGGAPPNPTLIRSIHALLLLLLYVAATVAVVLLLLRIIQSGRLMLLLLCCY